MLINDIYRCNLTASDNAIIAPEMAKVIELLVTIVGDKGAQTVPEDGPRRRVDPVAPGNGSWPLSSL
jgi:hypothetical protein